MANIDQLDCAGKRVCGWCFVPTRNLAAADCMLAQKVALETMESRLAALICRREAFVIEEVVGAVVVLVDIGRSSGQNLAPAPFRTHGYRCSFVHELLGGTCRSLQGKGSGDAVGGFFT
jgi:hypothetical protein